MNHPLSAPQRYRADRQGGNIVKGKVVLLSMLAVIGILALSATGAQASGGGGVPSVLTGFLVCHEIEGKDPGRTFDVESPIFGPGPIDPLLGVRSDCTTPARRAFSSGSRSARRLSPVRLQSCFRPGQRELRLRRRSNRSQPNR